jgi:Zn-finger nucleic acid-binding protein
VNCPACDDALNKKEAGGITVDVCGSCRGIWFDQFELMKVDEPHESAGEALLEIAQGETITVDPERTRHCPRCEAMPLRRHFFSVAKNVTIDECPDCGGVWLDVGELATIRTQFDSEEERQQAADAYFAEVFGGELSAMREESEEKAEKARKFAHMFRFLCPSYYISGKQKWGAF